MLLGLSSDIPLSSLVAGLLATDDESIGTILDLNMDDPTVTSSPEAQSLALLIKKYIGSSVAKFQDPAKFEPLVQELGASAAKYKVTDAHCRSRRPSHSSHEDLSYACP